jgi:hypothetical protein
MRTPAYSKTLIERRKNGDHPNDVFISLGWPSTWLRDYVATSPFAKNASILACLENANFDFSIVRGLSICIWIEKNSDAAQADEIASQVMAHSPLRCFVINAVTGAMTWHRASEKMKVAA